VRKNEGNASGAPFADGGGARRTIDGCTAAGDDAAVRTGSGAECTGAVWDGTLSGAGVGAAVLAGVLIARGAVSFTAAPLVAVARARRKAAAFADAGTSCDGGVSATAGGARRRGGVGTGPTGAASAPVASVVLRRRGGFGRSDSSMRPSLAGANFARRALGSAGALNVASSGCDRRGPADRVASAAESAP